ncbi:hypothetical protein GTR04_5105 [Trichophyton interdigitale]|uniref:Uncharacterized protein n=1 Tax=Trichophyton interdigitale TaxID=101480 RepID=A0A9P4YF52_9EURO|nr:hypothetical protein GY631_4945 [Trichophyton interdigitale]KAF3892182.1 hypothetical protein GY632_4771 [Trichophyton interdigitale]KAG8207501.1 hypothetical protein GTR04_5105 [Trichophyton interdigitale]
MGIPLDYTPPASRSRPSAGSGVRVSAEAGSKPPTDPTAAARSSIRRSPHPHPQSSRRLSRLQTGRRTATIRDLRDRHLIFDPVTRTIDRDRSSDRELPLPRIARNPVADHATGSPDSAEAPAGLSRREIGRRLLRDSVNYASPGRRMRIPRDLHGQDILPLAAPNSLRNRPSYSPRFAPAHPEDASLTNIAEAEDSSTTEGTMDASMPLLRRVGHRSVATARNSPSAIPAPSFSQAESVVSADEEVPDVSDTWARLLNTIPLDNNLPSADSSFTSATASASASGSGGSRSSTTAPTSLTPSSSFGSSVSARMHIMFDPFPSFPANCDYISSSENSDTEAEDHEPERPRGYMRRSQPRSQSQSQSQTPTQTQNPAQPQSESNTPADSSAPTASSFTLENEAAGLQLLHDTLNLLSRRDDIPDEWWATAGLTRIINRELNRELSREQNAE